MSDTSDISDGQDQMSVGRFHKFIEYVKSIRWLSDEPWKFFAYTAMKFTYIFMYVSLICNFVPEKKM